MKAAGVFQNSRLYRIKPDCLSVVDMGLHGPSEKKSAAGEAFDGNKSVNSFYWSSSRYVSGVRETDPLDFLNSRLYHRKPDCQSAADKGL